MLLTASFVSWLRRDFVPVGLSFLLIAVGLCVLCFLLITAASRQLERIAFRLNSIKTADMEIVGFVIAYLLPLANSSTTTIDPAVLAFVLAIFALVVWGTNSYHFNPLLAFFGYHFYEVTTAEAITYVLVTRRTMRDTTKVQHVVQLTEYMMLEAGER